MGVGPGPMRSMYVGVTSASIAMILLLISVGCGRERKQARPAVSLPVHVLADTAPSERLRVEPPLRARIWMARVTPTRPSSIVPGLPEAMPDTLTPEPSPPTLMIDESLKPPILKSPGSLRLAGHRGMHPRRDWVDIDVRVDEDGRVSDALWAGGSRDSMLVHGATECALSMRFYPALKAGRPIAVWCRQRFEFHGP